MHKRYAAKSAAEAARVLDGLVVSSRVNKPCSMVGDWQKGIGIRFSARELDHYIEIKFPSMIA